MRLGVECPMNGDIRKELYIIILLLNLVINLILDINTS